ncbi:Hypothetical protein ABZS17H1_03242 [Kosakonia cowanii]
MPDGANAYPAYKILTPAGWRWRLSGLRKSSPCRMALALIRPTKTPALPDKGRDLSGL